MANAQFRVDFQVVLQNEHFLKSIYLASPDLKNVRDAHKRARATAKLRLNKWLAKTYPPSYKFEVRTEGSQCVG